MTRRLPQLAFGFLVLATGGAFFVVQALKTQPPVLWATPVPSAINPTRAGRVCISSPTKAHPTGVPINYREAKLTVSVSHTANVGVYVVSANNAAGNSVATVSSGTSMVASHAVGEHAKVFVWHGRLDTGQLASPGLYYFRIVLRNQDRSINLSKTPVQVITKPPRLKILSVRLIENASGGGAGAQTSSVTGTTTTATGTTTRTGTTTVAVKHGHVLLVNGPAVIAPPHGSVRITFTPGVYRRAQIDIYRTDVAGGPTLVDWFPVTKLTRNWINWDGKIGHAPAPAGTYLVGITAQDVACNRATWPALPLATDTTERSGVTVRYLSVTPPLTPTSSGARARVSVDSAGTSFTWRLRLSGSPKVLEQGSGPAGASGIRVRMPRRRPGLYTLSVRAGAQSATVPLVASQAGMAAAHARVLVVLPMLSWMGNTAVDDSGDGLPDTLRAGNSVSLARPLVDGPPTGFGQDATLLSYLTAHNLSYQLTTDVALTEGVGPSLADRGGVIIPEGEDFLPAGLESILRGFVSGGGRVLTLGTHNFSGVSHITGFPATPRAGAPRLIAADPFGAARGPVTPTGGALISSVGDDFNLFSDAGSYGGFNQYQPITIPSRAAGGSVSRAGVGGGTTAIVAFHYGSGTVVEVGLAGFAASLASNPDSQHLIANAWQILSQ